MQQFSIAKEKTVGSSEFPNPKSSDTGFVFCNQSIITRATTTKIAWLAYHTTCPQGKSEVGFNELWFKNSDAEDWIDVFLLRYLRGTGCELEWGEIVGCKGLVIDII